MGICVVQVNPYTVKQIKEVEDNSRLKDDLTALGEEGIKQVWHDAKLRERSYSRAREIIQYAKTSVGIRDGAVAVRRDVIFQRVAAAG